MVKNILGLTNVQLYEQNHAEAGEKLPGCISAAMFNLGYLPRSDHEIVTTPESTLAALEAVWRRVGSGGIITVLAYRGHEGGADEARAVEDWGRQKPACLTETICSNPPRPQPPVLFVFKHE